MKFMRYAELVIIIIIGMVTTSLWALVIWMILAMLGVVPSTILWQGC